jgi:hypothetical protein
MTLRILMTLDAVGGVWRYAIDLGQALRARGHEIVLAGLGPEPGGAQRAEAQAIGTLEWGVAPLDWLARDEGELAGVGPWLRGLVRRYAPAIVHLNLPSHAAGWTGAPPCIAVLHSCLATWFRTLEGGPVPAHLAWQVRLTERGLRDAACAVAPSRAFGALAERTYRLGGFEAVANASRTALRPPSAGDGSVVAAARWWDRAKNGAVLDAAAGLVATPVTMIGACEGPDGQRFTARHAAAPGALDHDATQRRIAAASLFVSPSRYEPFGLAALEAARAGRPLLLADIPVYREIWDGAAAFFEPADAEAAARAIAALMAAPTRRLRLGEAAQRRALCFSPDAQAGSMETLYTKALAVAPVA